MLWSLTKWNHRLSTTRLVRWWLRMTPLDRFFLVIVVNFLFLVYSFFTFILWLINYGGRFLRSSYSSESFFGYALEESIPAGIKFVLGLLNFITGIAVFFEFVFLIFAFGLAVFFIIDLIWDALNTRRDLSNIALRKDVILATRGEYMGGHPKLPHARFVYLTISGTLNNPYIAILLPGFQPIEYQIPLIDITDKKSDVDDRYGRPSGIMNLSLTSITPTIWKGSRTALNIEYSFNGRKYTVELGSFLRGNDEVQMWKNYLTCTQAEADTGEKPYGEWKSLPKKLTKKSSGKISS